MKPLNYKIMKNFLPILMLCGVMSGCAQVTPPHAASTKTWVIESPDGSIKQTWSDAIHIPACNKEDFDGGTEDSPKADCRSYTFEGRTCYYYSWTYVDGYADKLCPTPWRVPSSSDFVSLHFALAAPDHANSDEKTQIKRYIDVWGGVKAGFAQKASVVDNLTKLCYWSALRAHGDNAWSLSIDYAVTAADLITKSSELGLQVRCVK
jgi:uncharacterized protein (TIGR02145 family)